ncbi:MFS transporter [Amycolatopsis sp. WAC 01376]|uniref:MFS transporter n=1 Tax=Amycolatopsis sp. WAC 01376 TaxID=2203195 RepID=UPI000F7AD755|nr:MFS transporter [Amycolatopsis sp. WAC 01376]RSM52511.1 MFS transporter [Amycolatopsis sp. WAC 01376]
MSTSSPARRRDHLVLALACLGSFVVVLDATIVSVALPRIRADLGFSAATLPWVVNAYTLAFAGCLLLGGRCADVFGRRRVLLAGMGLFAGASLLAGLAADPALLLAARAGQGVGGALLMPATLSLLTDTFPAGPRRARALSTWSAIGAVGAASGPLTGGLLTEFAGWRWVFFVNVPLGLVAVAGTLALLPGGSRSGSAYRLDVVGAVLATAGLTGVVYAVMESETVGWSAPEVSGPLIAGIVLCGLFLLHQGRWAAAPLVPLSLFRHRAVRGANLVMFLLGLGFFGAPVLISFVLQYVHGAGPLAAGLGFLPAGLAMFAGAKAAGPLTIRLGARRAAALGCVLGAAGLAGVAASLGTGGSSVAMIVLPSVVFGFGTASAFTPLTVAATSGVPATSGGVAAAVLNTVRQTSGAIGLAVLTTIAAAAASGSSMQEGLAHGYAFAFAVSAGCVAAAAVAGMLVLPPRTAERLAAATGRVRGLDGDPVPGAVALLVNPDGGRVVRTVTDETGWYHAAPTAPGPHLVICTAPSHQPSIGRIMADDTPVRHDVVVGQVGS